MDSQLPLYKDQIHSNAWIELCDYAFDEIVEPWVFDKAAKSNLHLFDNKNGVGKSGVIYCGTNQSIENLLRAIPENGKYILITRDNDKSINEELYQRKPKSVKHWFAINCAVNHSDITAIPYGVGGISGYSKTLELIGGIERTSGDKLIYARVNCPPEMIWPHERHKCLAMLEHNPLATVIWNPIDGESNFKNMKSHPFVAAPIGTGSDCLRSWESLSLGAIPILTDCPETRQFEDLPVIYTKDWNLEKDYLEIVRRLKYKSTDKVRMSYWKNVLQLKKQEHGIESM